MPDTWSFARQEDAGLDIMIDGAPRSYYHRFVSALDRVDLDQPVTVRGRSGLMNQVPRIVGPIARRGCAGRGRPVSPRAHPRSDQDHGSKSLHDAAASAERVVRDRSERARAYAVAVNAEIKEQILLGVIDLSDTTVETAKVVGARTQRALPFVAAKRLVIALTAGNTGAESRGREDAGDGRRRPDRQAGT